jgi:glyoxylase-like metal-dependent hydrolase (beta-lactamase superfamily II)
MTRREAPRLGFSGLSVASASLVWQTGRANVTAQAPPPTPPNVYAYIQGGGPAKNNVTVSNAAFIVGDEGILLFDALAVPIHAKNMVAAIRKVTDKPFKYLITSHHHGDHIGGHQFIPPAR